MGSICGCGFVLWCVVGLFCGDCGFVGDAVLVVVVPHFFFIILFVIGDFVWSGLRKKIGDLVFFFFFSLWTGGGGGGGSGCGCGCGCGWCCGFFFE